jgi:hypothetical protein
MTLTPRVQQLIDDGIVRVYNSWYEFKHRKESNYFTDKPRVYHKGRKYKKRVKKTP